MSARVMLLLALALFAAASTLEVAVGQVELGLPLADDVPPLSHPDHHSAVSIDPYAGADMRRSLVLASGDVLKAAKVTTLKCKKDGQYCLYSGKTPNKKYKCYKKKCVDYSIFCGKPGNICPRGERCCSGKCKKILTDKNNCGACKRVCRKPRKGSAKCVRGVCNAY